ncbi:uncharacterized protein LOC116180263 [Photinus pyralis]|uniref:uncharacterized protein LOC116180263 n=1 Tax=Photinus pyralis TaxID=7054 RepID=UPI0012674F71|nr:uncharacterized protein LOC116180263 [Photinus pyralis]
MRLLFGLLLAVSAEETYSPNWDTRQEIMSVSFSECVCASGVDVALAEKWLNRVEFCNDPCFKCFLKCQYLRANFMFPDGTQNVERLVNSYDHVYADSIRACANKTITLDLCERAYEVGQCIVQVVLGTH